MKYWGKDREGNIFEKCLRCGSNSKKHFARGRCHTCYHKWLADNNPEYKEKLKIKKREQKKRREKRRIFEEREANLQRIMVGKEQLKNKYSDARNFLIEKSREYVKNIEKEKKELSDVIAYIEKEHSKGDFNSPKLLYLLVPCTAIKYLQKIHYSDKNLILILKMISNQPISLQDIYYSPAKGKFSFVNKDKIRTRFDEKVCMHMLLNKNNFLSLFNNFKENVGSSMIKKSIIEKHITQIRRILEENRMNIELNDWDDFFHIYIFGTPFNQNREFRVQVEALIRDSENEIRFEMDVPAIGEGWVSETSLFHKVKELCEQNGLRALHHARPLWLGLQHLDIYIPDLNLAIEYQGKQHSEPVGFFGGEKGHLKILERDRKKKELCEQNNIELISVDEGDNMDKLLNDLSNLILTK